MYTCRLTYLPGKEQNRKPLAELEVLVLTAASTVQFAKSISSGPWWIAGGDCFSAEPAKILPRTCVGFADAGSRVFVMPLWQE
jgi:hypothetical protein